MDKGGSLQGIGDFLIPDTMKAGLVNQALRNKLTDENNQRSAMSHLIGGRDPNSADQSIDWNPDAPPTGTYQAKNADGNWQTYSLFDGPQARGVTTLDDGMASLFSPRMLADQPLQKPMTGKVPTTDDGAPLFQPNMRQAVALQTPVKPDAQSLFGDVTPPSPSLFNDIPAVRDMPTAQQQAKDYAQSQANYLRRAAPDQFIGSAVQQALMADRLKSLQGAGNGLSQSDIQALALDPSGKLLGQIWAKRFSPSDQEKIIDRYNSLPDSDPTKNMLLPIIQKMQGLETDPDKIAGQKITNDKNLAETGLANSRKTQLDETGSFTPEMGELMAALAEQGVSLPAGMRSRAQQIAQFKGLLTRFSDNSPDEIARLIKTGQVQFGAEKKETQTAAGIAGKVQVAANEIAQNIPLIQAASQAVPRGRWMPINQLMQTASTSLSDPNLKRLKGYIQSTMNAYDMLGARGGSDMNKREENRKLLLAADGPDALAAALEVLQNEAKVAHNSAIEATKLDTGSPASSADIRKRISSPTGGGVTMPAKPNPSASGQGGEQIGGGAPAAAIAYLKTHPELAAQFDAKYGAGAAKAALGQ